MAALIWIAFELVEPDRKSRPSTKGSKAALDPETWMVFSDTMVTAPLSALDVRCTSQSA